MKTSGRTITVSAPGKIHLLGEHSVVYGKPALLTAINLRTNVILTAKPEGSLANASSSDKLRDSSPPTATQLLADQNDKIKAIIEPIVKKYLKIKQIPPYKLEISSEFPLGAGLGSSAAISSAYIGALLTFLKIKWDLHLINKLSFEAEKAFHGNPSGADNAAVVFGGLIWFRKETTDLKIIQPINSPVPANIAGNFILINTGKPKETTKEMVGLVKLRVKSQESRVKKIFDHQEQLVKELLLTIQCGNEKELIKIIRAGEKNLEKMGVVSWYVQSIIRKIEKAGGAAKVCGGGGKTKATGVLLAYHPEKSVLEKIAKSYDLPYYTVVLGAEGLRKEI